MDLTPHLFKAKVMHRRLMPKENTFTYDVSYLALPLPAKDLCHWYFRFDAKDLGERDGSDLYVFARKVLQTYDFDSITENIILMTMPRVLGYIFNPVSFYFCLNREGLLVAVITEVHNTFNEQHVYFSAHPDKREILPEDEIEAEKVFHVSPFLKRDGYYRFKFSIRDKTCGIWIDYYNAESQKQLITSLVGTLKSLSSAHDKKIFWLDPFVTLKTILLIHWQALKLVCKNIPYIKKPKQNDKRITSKLDQKA